MNTPSQSTSTSSDTTYDVLKEQFKTVNRALHDTSMELNSKVGELDVLTYYLNSILSHMSQGLLFINRDGYLTTCNAAAENILAIDSLNILFQPFADHFSDDIFGFSMKEALAQLKGTKKTVVFVETSVGVQKELEIDATFLQQQDLINAAPKTNNMDSLLGIIVLIRDITDLHRLQTLANRNDRMKALGEMAAMVAHEIRNPLGGIKGFASLLQRDLQPQPELQKLAAYIVEGTDNLNRLVTNVLNFARPVKTNIENIDMLVMINELCQHVKADENFNPKIQITISSKLPTLLVPVDIQLFKSAVLNLIVNAMQAMPDGGKITMNIKQEKHHAVLVITDTGLGISAENLKKLFSPFFTTKATGNGFGLAEVEQVIRAHGGSIDVESAIDKGTTFTIKIPLKPYGII